MVVSQVSAAAAAYETKARRDLLLVAPFAFHWRSVTRARKRTAGPSSVADPSPSRSSSFSSSLPSPKSTHATFSAFRAGSPQQRGLSPHQGSSLPSPHPLAQPQQPDYGNFGFGHSATHAPTNARVLATMAPPPVPPLPAPSARAARALSTAGASTSLVQGNRVNGSNASGSFRSLPVPTARLRTPPRGLPAALQLASHKPPVHGCASVVRQYSAGTLLYQTTGTSLAFTSAPTRAPHAAFHLS